MLFFHFCFWFLFFSSNGSPLDLSTIMPFWNFQSNVFITCFFLQTYHSGFPTLASISNLDSRTQINFHFLHAIIYLVWGSTIAKVFLLYLFLPFHFVTMTFFPDPCNIILDSDFSLIYCLASGMYLFFSPVTCFYAIKFQVTIIITFYFLKNIKCQ